MKLNAGVLIIGSLLWDLHPTRQEWRNERLLMESSESVTAPIRYGRLSSSRGNSYTMVFSRSAEAGQAKAVPCAHTVSTLRDLLAEAERLWRAEQPSAGKHRIAANWGCVALLCNPDKEIPDELLAGWAERVADEPGYGIVSQTQEEGEIVSKDGLLRIDWPTRVGGEEPLDLDMLLLTANDPTLTGTPPAYPTVEIIADAWNRAGNHVEYFWNNFDNGIQTFQDEDIRRRLQPRRLDQR